MNLNTADSEAEHKYLWYTWMYHKLQLPRLFEVKKNPYLLHLLYIYYKRYGSSRQKHLEHSHACFK